MFLSFSDVILIRTRSEIFREFPKNTFYSLLRVILLATISLSKLLRVNETTLTCCNFRAISRVFKFFNISPSSDIDDDPGSVSGSVSLGGFPPVEERSRPDGAEEEAPDTNRTSGDDGDDEEVFTDFFFNFSIFFNALCLHSHF